MKDEGLKPDVIKLPRSPKRKNKSFYPHGNHTHHHSYKCLNKKGLKEKENVNWFMWSDYSNLDDLGAGKQNNYLRKSRNLINSGTKSKIFRKNSHSRGVNSKGLAPDLSRGRFEKANGKSRSRREID